jgi:hypothetical protein
MSHLFKSILSAILHDSRKTAHPIAEDNVHVVKSEVIPRQWNRFFNFIIRVQLATLQNSFQPTKSQKLDRPTSGGLGERVT